MNLSGTSRSTIFTIFVVKSSGHTSNNESNLAFLLMDWQQTTATTTHTIVALHKSRLLYIFTTTTMQYSLKIQFLMYVALISKTNITNTYIYANMIKMRHQQTSAQREHVENVSVFVKGMYITQSKIVSNYCLKQCSNSYCLQIIVLFNVILLERKKIGEFYPL